MLQSVQNPALESYGFSTPLMHSRAAIPPSFSIRPIRLEDEAALAQLLVTCREDAFHWRDAGSFALADFAIETAGERMWVAEGSDGSVWGFISIWEPDDFIHHLYVHPNCQRNGVGEELMRKVLAFKETTWRLKCPVANAPGLAFYEKHGWTVEDRGVDVGSDYFLMRSPAPGREETSAPGPVA
ncbi:GNAT family N-acetyltransferase [Verrucomicrobium spinosum]|uniref:GNAT family N-acetyltransferase n=2 Tax=Verrucomicrobium spinosum TaxID=2736 RepID=UPI0006A73622|nr:N-acetyltransferase [Verrucomicrobium spinosum]